MSNSIQFLQLEEPFFLENGNSLQNLKIAYQTFGKLNKDKSNVIWVCHALTANTNVLEWWSGLFGEDNLFDPKDYFIICANVIGSAYGSTSPLDEKTNFLDFPLVTSRDLAKAHGLLLKSLCLRKVHLLVGASLGGQQALEWSILQPHLFEKSIFIATNAKHSAYGVGFNESQRLAIEADSTFDGVNPEGGRKGLVAARSLALLSYRNYQTYQSHQSEVKNNKTSDFKASSYQKYQGEKLATRFNAYSYYALTKTMDSHNVGRNRGCAEGALLRIKAESLVIGVTTDQLFPTSEQHYLAEHIPNCEYAEINSDYGHDGFLVETIQLSNIIKKWFSGQLSTRKLTTFKKRTA